jgi:hypothetical protein
MNVPTWAWSVIPTVAESPSTFTHSWVSAYFRSFSTEKGGNGKFHIMRQGGNTEVVMKQKLIVQKVDAVTTPIRISDYLKVAYKLKTGYFTYYHLADVLISHFIGKWRGVNAYNHRYHLWNNTTIRKAHACIRRERKKKERNILVSPANSILQKNSILLLQIFVSTMLVGR